MVTIWTILFEQICNFLTRQTIVNYFDDNCSCSFEIKKKKKLVKSVTFQVNYSSHISSIDTGTANPCQSDFYVWRESYEDIGRCQAHPGTFIMGHEAFKMGFISSLKHLLSLGPL